MPSAVNTTTNPVFIIGSGRSGTRTMFKLLSSITGVEAHHEFCCTHIQTLACKRSMGLCSSTHVSSELELTHRSAILLSDQPIWVDCSNKLTWVVESLISLFPNALFVNLIRDGRKVANSYFHKLSDEMYDKKSVDSLRNWINEPLKNPIPPPQKKYWWNIPINDMPFTNEFPKFNQFERAVYHWVESNRVASESLRDFVPSSQQLTLRLEDFVSNSNETENFCSFIGVDYNPSYQDFLKKPQNVIFPLDFGLTEEQHIQFRNIASPMMDKLGYDINTKEYIVEY
jgi:hypothetical protein